MADCVAPSVLSDISKKDVSRLVGAVAKSLAANSPFINVLTGGVFPSGVSDEIRTGVQMQAAPGDSLAQPTFVCDTELCGTQGLQDLTDSIDFTARLESKRGKGPRVCMKKGFASYKSTYLAAEDSLKKLITQYINADIRGQMYLRSASKFVAAAGYDFNSLFTGGSETDIGVQFAPILPTGMLSFKALHHVARYLREALFADMFPAMGEGQPHFRFIGGSDIVNSFREEAGLVQSALCCLAKGSFKFGGEAIRAYAWNDAGAFRGIAMGVDQRPLRASGFNADGSLALVDPLTVVTNACKNTAYARVNPAWTTAPYELAFLFADRSFRRLMPERYVGEGSFKFAPQLHMGELNWHYEIDNDCNVFGDFGWHQYQLTRAYQPERPQFVVPILFRRCVQDLGLEECQIPSPLEFSGADTFTTIGVCPPSTCDSPCSPLGDIVIGGTIAEDLDGDGDVDAGDIDLGGGDVDLVCPGPDTVDLLTAEDFSVLAGSTVTNTGSSVVNGDLGLYPGTSVTGFPPGVVLGTQHITDAVAQQAQTDLVTAYNDAAGRTGGITVAGNIGGQTLVPGLYTSASSLAISSGDLTLDAGGNPCSVWIFQIGSTLTTTAGRAIILTGGAKAANIFWQVGSSATLGTNSVFKGNVIALTSITATTGAAIEGRLLARNGAVTLDSNVITVPVP